MSFLRLCGGQNIFAKIHDFLLIFRHHIFCSGTPLSWVELWFSLHIIAHAEEQLACLTFQTNSWATPTNLPNGLLVPLRISETEFSVPQTKFHEMPGAPRNFQNEIHGTPDEFPKRIVWCPRRISKTKFLMPPTNPKRNFLVCYTCFNACWVSGHAWQPVVFEFVCDALTDISFSTLARMWWRRQRLIGRPFGGQAGIGTTKGHEPPSCAEIVRFIKRLVRIPLGGPLCCDISSKLIQPRNFLARCIGMFRLLEMLPKSCWRDVLDGFLHAWNIILMYFQVEGEL